MPLKYETTRELARTVPLSLISVGELEQILRFLGYEPTHFLQTHEETQNCAVLIEKILKDRNGMLEAIQTSEQNGSVIIHTIIKGKNRTAK